MGSTSTRKSSMLDSASSSFSSSSSSSVGLFSSDGLFSFVGPFSSFDSAGTSFSSSSSSASVVGGPVHETLTLLPIQLYKMHHCNEPITRLDGSALYLHILSKSVTPFQHWIIKICSQMIDMCNCAIVS